MKGTWKDIGTFYTKLTHSKLFRHFHVSTFYPTHHLGPVKMLKYWHKINKRPHLKKKKRLIPYGCKKWVHKYPQCDSCLGILHLFPYLGPHRKSIGMQYKLNGSVIPRTCPSSIPQSLMRLRTTPLKITIPKHGFQDKMFLGVKI